MAHDGLLSTRRATPEQLYGRLLREARRQKAVSQDELAYRSGYDRSYISQLERGIKNPTLRTMLILATALDASAGRMVETVETQWK